MMAFAMLLLPLMDAAGKYLALFEGVTPGTSSLWRFAIQIVLTAPVIMAITGPKQAPRMSTPTRPTVRTEKSSWRSKSSMRMGVGGS